MEGAVKVAHLLLLSSVVLIVPNVAQAQVAGSTLVGVAAAEMRDVAMGWSAKRQVLGASVYNDQNERIGDVDDIIIAPDKAISYAIVRRRFPTSDQARCCYSGFAAEASRRKTSVAGSDPRSAQGSPAFDYAH
jgi:hypothetical protein